MNRYKVAETRRTVRHRNSGYIYQQRVLNSTLSRLITEDPAHMGFVGVLENVVTEIIEQVKRIKTWVNFTVDKDDRNIT